MSNFTFLSSVHVYVKVCMSVYVVDEGMKQVRWVNSKNKIFCFFWWGALGDCCYVFIWLTAQRGREQELSIYLSIYLHINSGKWLFNKPLKILQLHCAIKWVSCIIINIFY